jgi:acetyltransferase-like isoleucine patch superfamily enzyme
VGVDARVRSGAVLYGGSRIGDRCSIGHAVVVREECFLGDDVTVWSGSVVDYGCRIGNGVKVHTNCYVAQYSVLDDAAFLAPGVSLANDIHPGDPESAAVMTGPHIGAGAQLGVNVTVLPFVDIGAGALVGAGSVVTRDLPAGAVAYGNPAVVVSDVADLADIGDMFSRDGRYRQRYVERRRAFRQDEG